MNKRVILGIVALVVLPVFACGSDGPADAKAFCNQTMALTCDKLYECVPAIARDADFVTDFGASLAECKTKLQADCATAATECPNYNASAASTCISKVSALTCAAVANPLPAECDQACPGAL